MKKLKIMTICIVFLSLTTVFFGIYYQLRARRQFILCKGNLRHWGTAFYLYQKQLQSTQLDPNFVRQQVQQMLYNKQTSQCPSVSSHSFYSYQMNSHAILTNLSQNKNIVLMFDSSPSKQPITKDSPQKDVDCRHLGEANFLFIDGHVENSSKYLKYLWNPN